MRLPRLAASASLLVACFLSIPAFAGDPEAAKALFERGVADLEAGRYDAACPAIEESYKLDPRPGTLFALAECETKRGHIAAAVARYDEYLTLYPTLSADKKAKQGDREKMARAQRLALESKVAELTLVLAPSVPKGTAVTRDGAPVDAKAFGVPAPVDPGEHVITVQGPGADATTIRVTLAAGEKRAIALEVKGQGEDARGPMFEPAPQPQAPEGRGANKTVLIAGGVVGGAAIVAGAALAGLYASKASSAESEYDAIAKTMACPPASSPNLTGPCGTLASTLNSKATFGSAAVGLLVAGGVVGIGTVVYGVAASRGPKATGVRVLPVVTGDGGGLVVEGAF
jgi:hypothetical protein